MKKANTVPVKRAKRLKAFDQEYLDYFTEYSNKSIDEKLSDLHSCHDMFIRQTVSIFESNFDKENTTQARAVARSARLMLRDLKHYELALTKHLEQIEVTGEWK